MTNQSKKGKKCLHKKGISYSTEEPYIQCIVCSKIMKEKGIWIAHGTVNHSYTDRLDCLYCINVEIEYLQEIKKAGGQTKFIEKLRI